MKKEEIIDRIVFASISLALVIFAVAYLVLIVL